MKINANLNPEQIIRLEKICDEEFSKNSETKTFRFKKLEKGIYLPTFDLINLCNAVSKHQFKDKKRVLDLGSGDGRVVFLFSLMGYSPTGVEYNEHLCKLSDTIIKPRLISGGFDVKKVRFKQGDFLNEDFSEYDIIYFFPGDFNNYKELEDKLIKTIKDNSFFLVYGQKHPFEQLRPNSLWQRLAGHKEGKIMVYKK